MKILSKPTATIEQMYAWLETKNPHPIAKGLCTIIWNEAISKGVNPVVAVTQAVKETGRFTYKGVLRPNYCNTCGLKTPKGGSCTDPDAHTRFEYWEDGIAAHIDHLCLYAGAKGFPRCNPQRPDTNTPEFIKNGNTLDPRHFPYLYGKAPKVTDLSNNWAGAGYGEAIVEMCKEVENMKVSETGNIKPCTCKDTIAKLEDTILNLQKDNEEYLVEINQLREDVSEIESLRKQLKQFLK